MMIIRRGVCVCVCLCVSVRVCVCERMIFFWLGIDRNNIVVRGGWGGGYDGIKLI